MLTTLKARTSDHHHMQDTHHRIEMSRPGSCSRLLLQALRRGSMARRVSIIVRLRLRHSVTVIPTASSSRGRGLRLEKTPQTLPSQDSVTTVITTRLLRIAITLASQHSSGRVGARCRETMNRCNGNATAEGAITRHRGRITGSNRSSSLILPPGLGGAMLVHLCLLLMVLAPVPELAAASP